MLSDAILLTAAVGNKALMNYGVFPRQVSQSTQFTLLTQILHDRILSRVSSGVVPGAAANI
jgi:hypothetical protein